MEDSAPISRESVEKEGEEAGLPAKLTKPTFCKVSPPIPLLRVIPCRAPAPPRRFCCVCVTRAAYPEGGEQPRSLSRAVLNCITCRVGAIKSRSRGAGRGTSGPALSRDPFVRSPDADTSASPKGLAGCTGSAPRAEL